MGPIFDNINNLILAITSDLVRLSASVFLLVLVVTGFVLIYEWARTKTINWGILIGLIVVIAFTSAFVLQGREILCWINSAWCL